MTADFPVLLDACVLVQACLRDTLLRLFQKRLFLARWSDDIIEEVCRTLQMKLQKSPAQTDHLVLQLREYFADAWIEGYADLVSPMTNDPKDRHVLAAAIRGGCESIVTFNTRDFPASSTDPYNVAVYHPDEFLIDLYYLDAELIVHVLHEQGSDLNPPKSLQEILRLLQTACPKFVQLICTNLDISLETAGTN
jgi:predicted nucleic acid-binding protein